jgi:hypothetical protein
MYTYKYTLSLYKIYLLITFSYQIFFLIFLEASWHILRRLTAFGVFSDAFPGPKMREPPKLVIWVVTRPSIHAHVQCAWQEMSGM